MRFFSCLISFVSRCIAAACIESGWTLYCKCTNFQANHNPLNGSRMTELGWTLYCKCTNFQANHNAFILLAVFALGWTLYCKCTNFQANHNYESHAFSGGFVGLYIANVLTFKRITTGGNI